MTAQLRIVPYTHHDDPTVTTSGASVVSGFEATNTQNTLRGRTLRSASTSGFVLKGTLPATRSATSLALFRHTAHGGDVQLELFSDAAWSSSVYDSTALSADCFTPDGTFDFGFPSGFTLARPTPYVHWFEETDFQSYEITFSSTPTAAYWEVCRVILGKAFEFRVNPDYGATIGWEDNTDSGRTMGGSQRTNNGEKWKTGVLDCNTIEEDERQAVIDIIERMGLANDGLLSLFGEDGTTMEAAYTFNFKFKNLGTLGRQIARLQKRFEIQEQ